MVIVMEMAMMTMKYGCDDDGDVDGDYQMVVNDVVFPNVYV